MKPGAIVMKPGNRRAVNAFREAGFLAAAGLNGS